MIWLVGNKGMLGREMEALLRRRRLDYTATDREVSILDPAALSRHAAGKRIDWIINCAGYTVVDGAEDEEDLATAVNADGAGRLAELAGELDAGLIHVSTDYVFDGTKAEPYREDDATNPLGAYGRSKLKGEEIIRASGCRHVIVRTSWLYGTAGPSFVHTMLRLMNERDAVDVVDDQIGSPTYTRDLTEALLAFIEKGGAMSGVYHYSDEGRISWYDFAREIFRAGREAGLVSRPCRIYPIATAAYPARARRPAFSPLSTEKIRKTLDLAIPLWDHSLRRFLSEDFRRWNETYTTC
ncbi:MAG: dTDP-4-dehydrorhamnose reductase [Spirochaetales bacterium]|nr:dTDP-4-dehydrorhamnose reductase [Spirochaetales bacterium]